MNQPRVDHSRAGSEVDQPDAKWSLCLACGRWQRTVASCGGCGWSRLAATDEVGSMNATGECIDGSTIRVLLDIEARSDGSVHASALHTDRLAPIRYNAILLRDLGGEEALRLPRTSPDVQAWHDLRAIARRHISRAVDELVRPRWPGRAPRADTPVEVCIRALVLDPQRSDWASGLPWVEVVPLQAALQLAGRDLADGALALDLHETVLSLDEGGNRLRVSALCSSGELMTTNAELWAEGLELGRICRWEDSTFLHRDRAMPIVDGQLPAIALWHLAPRGGVRPSAELRMHVLGRDRPVCAEVPCGDLGDRDRLVDLYLDLGSTTTKYVVQVGSALELPQLKRTAMIASEWGLPPYDKARLLGDPTGKAWCTWVDELVRALRAFVAKKHRGYLRSVHLTLPQSGSLPVALMAAQLNRPIETPTPLDGAAIRSLLATIATETVEPRLLALHSEHEAIACHYLEPLRVLRQAAQSFHGTHTNHERNRASQRARQAEWEARKEAQGEFERRNWFYRIFHSRPDGPAGDRPSVVESLVSPADWMRRLLANSDLLDCVVLLDAGGLSLDIAVLESRKLVDELSRSDATCGGEAVTAEFARRLQTGDLDSEDGTREKARLGALWCNYDNDSSLSIDDRFRRFGGRDQRTYHAVTRDIYDVTVRSVMSGCGARWQGTRRRCTMLLTGGASRNPHFFELVEECAKSAGLDAWILDAALLANLLNEASAFEHPLPELHAPAIELFRTVHAWAMREVRGSDRMAYDKYAVVGGLLAGRPAR